jgi:hypothetical protein
MRGSVAMASEATASAAVGRLAQRAPQSA